VKADQAPRVALIVETSLSVGRGILAGVRDYVVQHGRWSIYAWPHGLGQELPQWFKNWKGDGIIARFQNERIRDAVIGKGVPVVDVLGVCPSERAVLVHVNDEAIAEMAARHLWDFGYREFAYLGLQPDNWSLARMEAFKAWVGNRGCACPTLLLNRRDLDRIPWDRLIARIAAWLGGLELPVGLMLCSDVEGLLVVEACRKAGLIVGQNVGLIGVGNDPTLCELTVHPLSSVDVGIQTVGYKAAETLAAMMAGGPAPKEPVRIDPLFVETRASTELPILEDPALARAIQFMRAHCAEPIGVAEIAAHAGSSRSVLQRRFREKIGRTIVEELTGIRLRKALELLRTELTIDEIAERTGFGYPQNLARSFRKHFGKSPKHYRHRGMGAAGNDLI
jgi:LacI family transcriptional regulator